ncbi:MAG: LLM class flavin-dependent oxidoreductase [Pseudorhodobacter sp.]
MQRFSLLDLSPIIEGSGAAEALADTLRLAQQAERLGFHRFWVAEHHNIPGIASAATAVVIGHVAGGTRTIRVGAGGIMLPNHAPMVIAEQFGTLETLYPGRIDLGLGRAPGTDGATARALRRYMQAADTFPQDVVELLGFLGDETGPIVAVPGQGTNVPVWILGSSLFGAQLAAHLGLPYAFASHFAPAMLEEAADIYRRGFRPSAYLEKPWFMMAVGMVVADTDEEAEFQRSSQIRSFARLRSGKPGKLPPPTNDLETEFSAPILASARQALSCSAVGAPKTAQRQLTALVERYQPDEVIITAMVYDPEARLRSLEQAAAVLCKVQKVHASTGE